MADNFMKHLNSHPSIPALILVLCINAFPSQYVYRVTNRVGAEARINAADPAAPLAPCGAPNLALPAPLLPTQSLSRFVVEDFNRDGREDLVTLFFADTTQIGFAPGNSAGGFDSQLVTSLDIRPVYRFVLKAADFNNDRNPDLAILDGGAQKLYILLGNGQGSFAAPVSYKASPQGDTMVIADFNRDGNADVAAGSDFIAQYTVLLGTGTGGFRDESLNAVQGIFDPAIALGAGDFNGDNQIDLIYLGRGSFQFQLLPGDGSGKFGRVIPVSFIDQTIQGTITPIALGIGDVTADGKLDIVVASNKGLSVVAAEGAGGFAAAKMFLRETGTGEIYLGDFNGDGQTDIAAGPRPNLVAPGSDILLFRSMGNGSFSAPLSFVTGTARGFTRQGIAKDFNRDGVSDLLLTSTIAIPSNPRTGFVLVRGSREAGLAALVPQQLPFRVNAMALEDLDADGAADLVAAYDVDSENGMVAIMLNNGTGSFSAPKNLPAKHPVEVAVRDFTRDGKPDLAVVNARGDNVTIFINDGRANFSNPQSTKTSPEPQLLAVGDFNNDGRPDLIVPGNESDLQLLAGADNASFSILTASIAKGFNRNTFAIGDYNGDRNLDLAVLATNPTFLCQQATEIAILAGNGQGGFTESGRAKFTDAVSTLTAADLNSDGRTDLIAGNPCDLSTGGVAVALAQASGGFAEPGRYPVRGAKRILAVDINGDAKPDLIANDAFNAINILTNAGDGQFQFSTQVLMGGNEKLAAGDINKDGITDLVGSYLFANGDLVVAVQNTTRCAAVDDATVVSAASYRGDSLGAESIAALFGAGLNTETLIATSLPLPTTMAGTSVKVRDSAGVERLAPLFYVSPGQINFQLPPDSSYGTALITVEKGDGRLATDTISIDDVSPSLFSADGKGQGPAAAVGFRRRSGVDTFEPITRYDAALSQFVLLPLDLGPAGDLVFVLLYGTGLRKPANQGSVSCTVGGVPVPIGYLGESPGFIGLDQANIGPLPRTLIGRGEVDVVLKVNGKTANVVRIAIK